MTRIATFRLSLPASTPANAMCRFSRKMLFISTGSRSDSAGLFHFRQDLPAASPMAWCSRHDSSVVDSPQNSPSLPARRQTTPEQTLNDA